MMNGMSLQHAEGQSKAVPSESKSKRLIAEDAAKAYSYLERTDALDLCEPLGLTQSYLGDFRKLV